MHTPESHHFRTPRTARYYTLGRAGGETWFVLHGYRQLAGRFIRPFAVVAGDRRIVAPEGLSRDYTDSGAGPHGPESRVGATWMTREDRGVEIRDYVEYLDGLSGSVGEPDLVLGFSQGAATASRWAVQGAVRPRTLVLWAGLPAHDLDRSVAVERLAGTRVVFAVGTEDEYRNDAAVDEHRGWLEAGGVSCAIVEYPGGHRVEPRGLEVVAAKLGDLS